MLHLDLTQLKQIAASNEDTILGLMARQIADQGLSLQFSKAQLAQIAEDDPNGLGELLRDTSFNGEGLGCCSTFDLRPAWVPVETIPPLVLLELLGDSATDPEEASRARGYHDPELGISVYWFWDGDGTLIFQSEDFTLVNTDCKCTTYWQNVDLLEEARCRWNFDELVATGFIPE